MPENKYVNKYNVCWYFSYITFTLFIYEYNIEKVFTSIGLLDWKKVYESSALTQFVDSNLQKMCHLYVVELLGEVHHWTRNYKADGMNCLVLWETGFRNR